MLFLENRLKSDWYGGIPGKIESAGSMEPADLVVKGSL